jgi:hypothetical protein
MEYTPNGKRARSGDTVTTAGFGPQRSGDADVGEEQESVSPRRVAYLVLPNVTEPYLLARVRWPDVYQASSPVRPDWQDDPGLFDLPYSPASTPVTYEEAAEIASGWGALLPSEEEGQAPGPSHIRRMPADWANLSAAERRAWSIMVGKPARHPASLTPVVDLPPDRADQAPAPPSRRRRWSRRWIPALLVAFSSHEGPTSDRVDAESMVIDLTEPAEGIRPAVDLA